MHFDEVAIIGAGLSGLSLALFLKQHNIQCTIYELRSRDVDAPGALMLSPNALLSLDAIGIYDRIRNKGWHFRSGTFLNNDFESMGSFELGDESKYGYDCLRIQRQILLDELRLMVTEAGTEIIYKKKFSHVLSEDKSQVSFAFADGEQRAAGILIGADGTWSAVRKSLFPEAGLRYAGVMTIFGIIPTKQVRFPPNKLDFPISILGEAGACMLAQESADGSEMIVAVQYRTRNKSKRDWHTLTADKQQLINMMRQGYETWNDTVQSAIDAIDAETLFLWPSYLAPKLPKWISRGEKVILVGDAAHVIPPAAGQGASLAFEDVHSLSLLIAAAQKGKVEWKHCIEWWQQYRQDRTGKATELTAEVIRRRLPDWNGEGGPLDNEWLYGVQVVDDVEKWLAS